MMGPRKEISYESALRMCADLCARAEHCSREIADKLRRRGLPAAEVERVISRLCERGFIDDARYARAFARDKVLYSGWGKRKIVMALKAKGIGAGDVGQAFDSLDEGEYENAMSRVIRAKMRQFGHLPLSYEEMQKVLRFAAGRGFEISSAASIIRGLNAGD